MPGVFGILKSKNCFVPYYNEIKKGDAMHLLFIFGKFLYCAFPAFPFLPIPQSIPFAVLSVSVEFLHLLPQKGRLFDPAVNI